MKRSILTLLAILSTMVLLQAAAAGYLLVRLA